MRDMFFNMNQEVMLELKGKFKYGKGQSKIDITDFILLRRIGDFILSSKTVSVIKDNEIYHWVHYDTIQESLPVVFNTKKTLTSRVEKLKKLGLLINKKHTVKKSETTEDGFNKAGTYSIIQLSKDVRKLFDEPIKVKINESIPKVEYKGIPKVEYKGIPKVEYKGIPKVEYKGSPKVEYNKEPQESNPKKENPSLGNFEISNEEEQEIKHQFEKTKKLITVSSLFSMINPSFVFLNKKLIPLAKEVGSQQVINALKEIYLEARTDKIKDLEALIKSKIKNKKSA